MKRIRETVLEFLSRQSPELLPESCILIARSSPALHPPLPGPRLTAPVEPQARTPQEPCPLCRR